MNGMWHGKQKRIKGHRPHIIPRLRSASSTSLDFDLESNLLITHPTNSKTSLIFFVEATNQIYPEFPCQHTTAVNMGHLSRSLSEHLQGIAGAIVSFSSSILDHVTLKRQRGNEDYDEEDDDFDSIDIDPCEAVLEKVKVKRIGKYVEAIRAKTQPSDKKNIPVVEVGSPSCSWDQVAIR